MILASACVICQLPHSGYATETMFLSLGQFICHRFNQKDMDEFCEKNQSRLTLEKETMIFHLFM